MVDVREGASPNAHPPLYTPLATSQVYAINDVTLKGEGGVHINVTIRDEGGGGGLSVA